MQLKINNQGNKNKRIFKKTNKYNNKQFKKISSIIFDELFSI